MRVITTRQELVELAHELGVRSDWHDPDEQGLTARVEGLKFDNAGFWPTVHALASGYLSTRSVEQHVVISRTDPDHACDECGHESEPEDVAAINLATLLAWACGTAD